MNPDQTVVIIERELADKPTMGISLYCEGCGALIWHRSFDATDPLRTSILFGYTDAIKASEHVCVGH